MSNIEILQLSVLEDNYVYLIHEPVSGVTAAVDPAVAAPVLEALNERGWKLDFILNTHHHADHTDGNLELKRITGCQVIGLAGDAERIPGIDRVVADNDSVAIGEATARVLAVPGHTRGHAAWWFEDEHALFCGDTLFALGCGRLFEGDAEQMWQSLDRLRRLPPETHVYCAHEYTEANARFALTLEAENPELQGRARQVDRLRRQGLPTVPSTLGDELATNPFLRPESAEIRAHLGLDADAGDAKVFAAVRSLKDCF
ncbi:hydroxyacylglutathione hydrolase [Candidatus Methylospira mobilis]|uniref:Hydroxyacylglutathione hydrolase n=1 Tax=Candidatus Methylospira mobilis TaxID=1808979 RepID=A0A5Q0BRG7_9GAMM|nr:hydroxyacylglutathione hydrolase [Candidatus Methylospira mobilis]QFY44667.1 hydroxyacylglutathione hydrolase [Candidatus Methylospira mobilis]WNV05796.1 hydroxyacylglutathione hydrolase [Candidatus Methylospira mobilis]